MHLQNLSNVVTGSEAMSSLIKKKRSDLYAWISLIEPHVKYTWFQTNTPSPGTMLILAKRILWLYLESTPHDIISSYLVAAQGSQWRNNSKSSYHSACLGRSGWLVTTRQGPTGTMADRLILGTRFLYIEGWTKWPPFCRRYSQMHVAFSFIFHWIWL